MKTLLNATIALCLSAAVSWSQSLPEALNPALSWTTGGNTSWLVTTNTTHDSVAAAESGEVNVGGVSWIETTVTGPAAVDFWWLSYNFYGYNSLRLQIAGALQTELSTNTTGWQRRSFYVPAGSNPVRWSLTASSSASTVGAKGWLDEVALSVPVSPSISTHPTNQTTLAGNNVLLVAEASGTEPLSLQWLKDGTPAASANMGTLALANVQASHAGDYSLVASNPVGVVTSQVATLTVLASAPVFTLQPVSQGAPPFGSARFRADARGTLPLTWQWHKNGTPLAGQTSTTYSVSTVSSNNYGDYFVVANNSVGSTTSAVVRLDYVPVVAWGTFSNDETAVPAEATNVIDVCGGDYHCLALRADGAVVGWGANTWSGLPFGQATVPFEALNSVSIGAGAVHSLAARADGQVAKWGWIAFSSWQETPSEATNVVAVAQGSGAQHALALRADGTVLGWGKSNYALLNIPEAATNVVSVAAGSYHGLALRADGQVLSWGRNPDCEPVQLPPANATNVVAIATGWFHNLALRDDGRVVGWGGGWCSGAYSSAATVPAAATNVIAIACGGNHSMALKRDGTLLSWGRFTTPMVPPQWGTNVAAMAGTRDGTLFILRDGPPRLCNPLLDRTVTVGLNAFFYAKAVGAWPLSYQWQFNGTNLSGATNVWLSVRNAQTADSGLYSITVSNALGVVSGPSARLTVAPDLRLLLRASLGANGEFLLSASGQTGVVWDIESSTNLLDWGIVATRTNTTGTIDFTDTQQSGPQRFFRMRAHQ